MREELDIKIEKNVQLTVSNFYYTYHILYWRNFLLSQIVQCIYIVSLVCCSNIMYVQDHVSKLSRELSDMTLLYHQLMEDNELLREQLQESHSLQAQLSNEVIT